MTDKKSITKKVWAVFATHDDYGRYDEVEDFRGAYDKKPHAEKAARGIGWFGGQGSVEERIVVKAADGSWWITQMPFSVKINEYRENRKEALRKSALKKLTKQEIESLDLDDDY